MKVIFIISNKVWSSYEKSAIVISNNFLNTTP